MNDEFKYDSVQDRISIVKYLNAISEGIENGHLLFGTDQKDIVFEPQGLLRLEIKAKHKDKKAKLEIKIGWSTEKDKQKNGTLEVKTGKSANKYDK